MTPKEKERYKVWIRQAQFDLNACDISFEHEFYEWAAYQAEQAVEKALKSVIVHAGTVPPKIHKLSVLFGFCNNLNHTFRNTKFKFRYVESFAFISRYPFLIPGRDKAPHELISKGEALQAIDEAKTIVGQIEKLLQVKFVKMKEELPAAISQEQLERRMDEVKDIIVREFNPEKIVLFGSYARQPLPDNLTTADVLIIANTDLSFVERITKVRELTKGAEPVIEPLMYTPKEFKTLTEEEGESFFESALEEGRVIYEK